MNERFPREGHLGRVVLRSVVGELTLVCMLIICSCIVEYSHVINDVCTTLNHFLLHEPHARIFIFYINTEISISHEPTPFYRLKIFKIL